MRITLAIIIVLLLETSSLATSAPNPNEFVDQLGGFGTKDGKLKEPHGIVLSKSGDIIVADTGNSRVQVFDKNYKFKKALTNKNFKKPTGVTTDSKGNIYISDCLGDKIYKYSKNYNFLKSWGGSLELTKSILDNEKELATSHGKFFCPYSLTTDEDDNIYTTDMYNNRIQKFTSNGKFLLTFGSRSISTDPQTFLTGRDGTVPKTTFKNPSSITYKNNKLFVADTFNNRVQVFDKDGDFIKQFGGVGNFIGRFNAPSGIAVDNDGNIYVSEFKGSKVTVFNKHYQFKTKWGGKGIGNSEFQGITGITVDKDGFVYVTDWGNHRIKKFKSIAVKDLKED